MNTQKADVVASSNINSTDSYSSKNFNSTLTPQEKHILYVYGESNKLFITIYNAVVSYFSTKIEFKNLPTDFNSNDIWNKLKNGNMAFIKYRKKIWPVNITVNQMNFLEKAINITITESLTTTLNGKNYQINEFGEFKDIAEIRLNQKRFSLLLLIKPYLNELAKVWKNIREEDRRFLDFYILNKSILKTSKKEETEINRALKNNEKLVHIIDFQSISNNPDADYKNLFIPFVFVNKTQPLIDKYNFIIMELFKSAGIIVNNMADKKGANLVSQEITTESTRTSYYFTSFVNQINYDLDVCNKILGTDIYIEVKEDSLEKAIENPNGGDNNDDPIT